MWCDAEYAGDYESDEHVAASTDGGLRAGPYLPPRNNRRVPSANGSARGGVGPLPVRSSVSEHLLQCFSCLVGCSCWSDGQAHSLRQIKCAQGVGALPGEHLTSRTALAGFLFTSRLAAACQTSRHLSAKLDFAKRSSVPVKLLQSLS